MSLRPSKSSPLKPGYRLDRYELLCPIAQGGMASVWVARMQGKHGFEKLVAIKTILPKFASDFRFQQMFLDEARIASGIEHANVAQILDLGEEHDVLYLVMEWVDGDALNKLQRALERHEPPLTIPHGIAARVIADACGGLHAAHELHDRHGAPLGVVHRDVSPHNILVSAKGVAKVIDFGIAKARDRLAGDTNTGFLKGKIQYMAPEQALGRDMDARADVWALGAILYHLYAGRPPYDGPNPLATLHLLTSGSPPAPLPSSVPPALAEVVRTALAHDPAARFRTAADLQRALESAMIEAEVTASNADVAGFTATHLRERVEARKVAIDLALQAAAERGRVERLLVPTSSDSEHGVDERGDAEGRVRSLSLAPIEEVVLQPSGAMTVAETGRRLTAKADGRARDALSESSPGTLGSTTVEPISDGAPRRRRNRTIATALGVLAAAALAVSGVSAMVANGANRASHAGGEGSARTIAGPSTDTVTEQPPPAARTALPAPALAPEAASTLVPVTTAPTTRAASVAPRLVPHAGWTASPPRPAPVRSAPTRKTIDDGF